MPEFNDLIRKMTLKEKLAQMTQLNGYFFDSVGTSVITGPMHELGIDDETNLNAGSVLGTTGAALVKDIQKRYLASNTHGIPLVFMADVIHGYRTIFPVPLALGCTWDLELVEKTMRIAAKEASAAGVHVNFSPMVDLVRDARWGRVVESTGEDPYLNSLFARAFVRGYQGNSIKHPESVAACVKHFAAYGAAEGGRDYNSVEMGEPLLRDHYLPSYHAAVDEGCIMVMTSFNTINGIPSTANEWLYRKILRDEWNFKGTVISDWGAVHELTYHGVAEDDREAALKAIRTGVDFEMMSSSFITYGEQLVEEGLLSESLINEAVLRILELKDDLGLFENPYRNADEELEARLLLCEEHRKLAREAAVHSMVLLKNESSLLPLSAKDGKKLALIGPYAEARHILGAWSCEGRDEEAINLLEGIYAKVDPCLISVCRGCGIEDNGDEDELQEVLSLAKASDIILLALGEHPGMSGEAGSRGFLTLPGNQQKLADAVLSLGKPTVVVLFNGRPLEMQEIITKADAILEAWFPGSEGGNAVADILFGDASPSGRLTMSFPYTIGQVPVYYNCLSTGRPKPDDECKDRFYSMYIDIPNKPIYPFGYGLAYTTFEYSDISLDSNVLRKDQTIKLSATVKNTGARAGVETVQFYIRDISGSRSRPVLELKGFERVSLEPGETCTVAFYIEESMLRFTTLSGRFEAEEGKFTAFAGPNAHTLYSCNFEYRSNA